MKRIGLFVGVDKYQNGISSLNCCCNDASDLNNYFAKHFDEVKFLLNEKAHCDNIIDQVTALTEALEPGDLFLFYFAGHGREFDGEHYLVGPSGRSEPALYRKGTVTVPELLELSNKSGINRLFILDCCRSDMITGRGEAYFCSNVRDISLDEAVNSVKQQEKCI